MGKDATCRLWSGLSAVTGPANRPLKDPKEDVLRLVVIEVRLVGYRPEPPYGGRRDAPPTNLFFAVAAFCSAAGIGPGNRTLAKNWDS
jgi:hypothetical protein